LHLPQIATKVAAMPELMMSPVAAMNQASPGPSGAAPAESSRSAPAQGLEEKRTPQDSFATVLRKQVEQGNKANSNPANMAEEATNNATNSLSTDPLVIAATDPSAVIAVADTLPIAAAAIPDAPDAPDAAAILPLLAQLMASPASSGNKTIGAPESRSADDPADGSPTAIAELLGRLGDSDAAGKKTPNQALIPEPVTTTPDPDVSGIKNPLSNELVPKPAISAEADVPLENTAASNIKPESDFAALLGRANNGLSANHAPTHAATTRDVTTSLPMERPVGHPAWNNELADKMTWMATSQRQQADLVLNPPQLGRVEISLTVTGDQASAVFASPNAAVREMLENSLPRLREILAGAGINLGEAQVGAESPGQPSQEQNGSRGSGGSRNQAFLTTDALAQAVPNAHWQSGTRSMVDIFA
jgi:flagellar hook-length control protein FliK